MSAKKHIDLPLHKRLKYARTRAGLYQRELADAVGVAPRMIEDYEQARRLPGLPLLITIAQTLRVSTDYLLGLIDDPRDHVRKLTEDDYHTIKQRYDAGEPIAAIAAAFNVSQGHVSRIGRGYRRVRLPDVDGRAA